MAAGMEKSPVAATIFLLYGLLLKRPLECLNWHTFTHIAAFSASSPDQVRGGALWAAWTVMCPARGTDVCRVGHQTPSECIVLSGSWSRHGRRKKVGKEAEWNKDIEESDKEHMWMRVVELLNQKLEEAIVCIHWNWWRQSLHHVGIEFSSFSDGFVLFPGPFPIFASNATSAFCGGGMCIARLGLVMEAGGRIDNIDAMWWPLIFPMTMKIHSQLLDKAPSPWTWPCHTCVLFTLMQVSNSSAPEE